MAVTPMMRQYLDIKEQYKDSILFFRLGDFYEMFYDDAELASKELELTLTGKDCGEPERAPMCGIPYHSADGYIAKLVGLGHKVAICEQTENPALAAGLVKREIVRIVTPGTVTDGALLNEGKNNYLCAIYLNGESAGVSFADISTGDISAAKFSGEGMLRRLINELGVYNPKEILLNTDKSLYKTLEEFANEKLGTVIDDKCPERFELKKSVELVKRQFGITNCDIEIAAAAGALLDYTIETQKTDISYIKNLKIYTSGQYMELDVNTRRNLELCETMRNKEKKGTLLWVLDHTETSMGARLLRKWIEFPLMNPNLIKRRQNAVSEFYDSFIIRNELGNLLKKVTDVERLMTKVVYGTANGRDMRAISVTISVIPQIRELIKDCASDELKEIFNNIDELTDIYELIESAIIDEPPVTIREGGFIRDGYDKQLDELHEIMHGGKGYIERIEAEEKEKTGIKNLKIGYNRVFGYYIEITKSNIGEAPDRYIRKQTLANCERYITEELKDVESTVLGASDKINALEYDLFQQLRETVAKNVSRIQDSASKIALLDVYASLADSASKNNYVCPYVEYGDEITIKEGRHPVVEQFVKNSYFVPNDTKLDNLGNRMLIITGPNMAGKSTYMRQVALITLMAQIGSFVPAKEADIGIVDKIFTRVGASDDLASGQSTFMLEMNEVAYILKNATKRSLIIYDEIGRGTSTFDGMSIARAVAEYTSGRKLGAKTLFATHYHELTELENELDGVVNYNIAAKKRGDSLTFLRKIVRGAADDSYGIEVAKLAGIPNEIIKRAKEVLKTLEAQNLMTSFVSDTEEIKSNVTFDDCRSNDVIEKLKKTDIDILSPLEAMNLIYELKKMLE